MTLSDLASLGSFVSGVAVLASLIFLFFQMRQMTEQVRQSEKNQQAVIRQGRADRLVAAAMGSATSPALADAALKAFTGASDITATQLYQFSRYCHAQFISFEDSFHQHQDGLLTDSAFASVVNSLGRALRAPSFRAQWKRLRTFLEPEFVEFTDKLMARTPIEPRSYDPTEWLNDVAVERSGAPT